MRNGYVTPEMIYKTNQKERKKKKKRQKANFCKEKNDL